MASNLRGTPPPLRQLRMNVTRVLTSESTQFIVVCRSRWGQPIHWYGNRSHECKGEHAQCDGCKKNWPIKWKAYLHVMGNGLGNQAFLEVTETAYKTLDVLMAGREDWRGAIIKIRRTKGGAKGRYICEVLERVIPDQELPIEVDPLPTLRYLWGVGKAPGIVA